jgi:hypothetical protein
MNRLLDRCDGRSGRGPITEFCERFARQQECFFFDWGGWSGRRAGLAVTRAIGAIVEVATRAALVVPAAIVAISALRSCVLRRRKISAARGSGTTTTATTASASAAPTASAATIAATVSTAIEIATAATPALIRAIVEARRGIVLGRVVLRSKILRRRFVRIGLALIVELFGMFGNTRNSVFASGVDFFDVRANLLILWICVTVFAWRSLTAVLRSSQRFARENFNQLAAGLYRRRCVLVTMIIVTVIIAFEIFEDVTNVEECVAVQADVHKSGLHARKNASDFSFVNAADEGEFFFALDVDFD